MNKPTPFTLSILVPLFFQPTKSSHQWDEISFHPGGKPKSPAPFTLLPQKHIITDDNITKLHPSSPAALDGSPYGLYFSPSKSGSTKWTIKLDGGGWCLDENYCYKRTFDSFGSSDRSPPEQFCQCLNTNNDHNDYDHDCNCLRLLHLDGASFSGYRSEPIIFNSTKIYFRGIVNLDAGVDFALENGLGENGTDFVLTGGSAGGLATFLHVDRVAERIRRYRRNMDVVDDVDSTRSLRRGRMSKRRMTVDDDSEIKIHAVPEAGFFLDHDTFDHSSHGGLPNTNFSTRMRHVYHMHNLTFGNGLMPECEHFFPDQPWSCFMSPHMQRFVRTPFFMFNSMYDLWQLQHVLQLPIHDMEKKGDVRSYGESFLKMLEPVYGRSAGGRRRNGGYITSCVCHSCPWSNLKFGGKMYDEHYFRWMKESEEYEANNNLTMMHIDARLPNGNGTLTGPGLERCQKYPRSEKKEGEVGFDEV